MFCCFHNATQYEMGESKKGLPGLVAPGWFAFMPKFKHNKWLTLLSTSFNQHFYQKPWQTLFCPNFYHLNHDTNDSGRTLMTSTTIMMSMSCWSFLSFKSSLLRLMFLMFFIPKEIDRASTRLKIWIKEISNSDFSNPGIRYFSPEIFFESKLC